jgi:hypothetical protein
LPGTVKVWAIDESPLVGEVEPSCAHQVPPWQPLLTAVSLAPLAVQPASEPCSKSPLTMAPPPPPPALVTVSVTVAVCEPLVAVPLTVSV